MAKSPGILLVVWLVLSLLVVGCANPSPTPAAQSTATTAPTPTPTVKPVTLRFAFFSSPGGAWETTEAWWAQEVEKRTGGQVKIELYWGGVLGSSTEVLDAVQRGGADLGVIPAAYYATKLPLIAAMDAVPFRLGDHLKLAKALVKLQGEFPELEAQFTQWNQKLLFIAPNDTVQIISRKPIRNLDDMKGLRVRSWGTGAPEVLGAVGASGPGLAAAEAYDALSKGTFDAAASGVDVIYKYKWHEVAKYLVKINYGCSLGHWITINSDAWRKLSPQVQETMLQVGREFPDKVAEVYGKVYQDILKSFADAGVQITEFPAADIEKWKNMAAVQAVPEKAIAAAEAKGLPAKRFIQRFLELTAN